MVTRTCDCTRLQENTVSAMVQNMGLASQALVFCNPGYLIFKGCSTFLLAAESQVLRRKTKAFPQPT